MAEDTPSEVRSATSAVHATLVAAIVAAVLAAALSLALFWSFMSLPGVTDGLQALWVMPLTPAAAVVGGIAGAAMASLRSDRLPTAARVLSAAAIVVIYLPLAAMAFRVPWSTDVVVVLALAGVGVLVPVAVAANLQALRTRPHPGRARAILALAAVGLCVVGPWGLAARAMVQEIDVVDAQWVEDVAVTPSGQIVVSTLAGVYVLGPEDTELRRAARPWGPGIAALIAAAQDDAGQLWAVAGAVLWESDDWGARWRKVRDIPPDFIESGKELVATQDAVYLAAGDNILYVRRSDGRGHWEEHAIPGYDPTCIAPSTEEPGTLIVGSYYGAALYRSRDYGAHWEELSVPAAVLGDRGLDVFDAVFVPRTPETLAVATAEQILLSQDRGDTWTSQDLPEAMTTGEALLAAAGEPSPRLYLATDVGVFASEDLCATWERLPLAAADEAGEMVLGLAVAPGNSDRVYAGLTDGLYRSTDGGRTWHRIPVAGERRGSLGSYAPSQEWEAVKFVDPGAGGSAGEYYDLDFVNERHGWVACSGVDVGGRVIHTLDGGSTWTTQGISAILLDFVDENVGWAVGGALGELWRTVNGGATWTKTAADHEMITNVAAVSEQEAWAIDGGILVHTVDGGESWRAVAHPLSENPTLLLEALCFLDRRHGWVLGVQSGGMMPLPISVLRTADGGESFQAVRAPAVPTGNEPPFRMQFRSAMEGWAAVGGPSLLHTTDGGETWRAVTPVVDGEELEATYYDCCFVSPDQGWAVGSTGLHAIEGEALAVATSDGGRTWRRCTTGVEGVVHGMLRRVVFTDARHGWTAGRGGMWASDFPVQQEPHKLAFLLRYSPLSE